MNPKPLSSLNHFTVPVGITFLHCMSVCLLRRGGRLEKLRPASARTAFAGMHRRRSPRTVARPRGGAIGRSWTRYALPMTDKVHKSDQDWRAELTPEQYEVLRRKGTERAFTGALHDHKGDGTYRCAGCGAELFASDTKFDSGTGWPSFYAPAETDAESTEDDRAFLM